MAAHIVLLLLLLCKINDISAAAGLPQDVQDLPETSSKTPVLHHSESMDNSVLFMRIKEEDDIRTLPNVDFKVNDRDLNDFDFKSIIVGQTVMLKHPKSAARSLIPIHSPELSLNHEKRGNLTNGDVEGVINDHSLASSSEEEYTLQPELNLETGVNVLPERTWGRSKWVTESENGRSWPYLLKTGPRSRRRRSWLWNQFFVIEEYRGPEPVLIGRVSCCHNLSVCIRTASPSSSFVVSHSWVFTVTTPATFNCCRCCNTKSVGDDLIHSTPEPFRSQGFTCSISQPGTPH